MEKFPNLNEPRHVTSSLNVLRLEMKQLNKNNKEKKLCAVFSHPDFDGILYCAKRYAKVTNEGPESGFFDNDNEFNHSSRASASSSSKQKPFLIH